MLNRVYTTTELLALAGSMDMLIGVRLHALVFASLMEKPVIGISYDPKIANFLHMIGEVPIGTLDDISADALTTEATKVLTDRALQNEVRQRIISLREESLKNAHIALSLLSKKVE